MAFCDTVYRLSAACCMLTVSHTHALIYNRYHHTFYCFLGYIYTCYASQVWVYRAYYNNYYVMSVYH